MFMKKLAYFTVITSAALAVTGCVVEENTYVTTTRPHYHQHPVRHVERTQTVYYTQQPATSSVNVYYNKRDKHHHRAPAPSGYYTQPNAYAPSSGYHTQPSSAYSSGRHPGYSSQPNTAPARQNNYGPAHEGYSSQPSSAPVPAPQNNYGSQHSGYSSQPSSSPVPVPAPQSSGGYEAQPATSGSNSGYQTQPVANNDIPKVEAPKPVVAETPKAQEPAPQVVTEAPKEQAAPLEPKPAEVAPVANTESTVEEKKAEEKPADSAAPGYSTGTPAAGNA